MNKVERIDPSTNTYARVSELYDKTSGRYDIGIAYGSVVGGVYEAEELMDVTDLNMLKMLHHVLGEYIKREDSKDEG